MEKSEIIESIDLVFETEISGKKFHDFKIDFDKLLFATKSTKMILFTKVNKGLTDKILKYVHETLNNFKDFDKNEKIYIIFWDESDTGSFEMEVIQKTN